MSDNEIENVFVYSEDLNNAEAPNPLPAGNYPAEVRKSEIADSKSKPGNKNLVLGLYIAPESYPHDYLDGNPDGTTLTVYRPLQDTTRGRYRMKKFNEVMGVKSSKTIDPNDYMGCACTVKIDTRMGMDGLPQENVAEILAKQ